MRSTCCSATNVGRSYLGGRRKIDADLVRQFDDIGISGLANIVAAIKLAKHLDFGPNDVIMTVATDSADALRQRTSEPSRAPLSATDSTR